MNRISKAISILLITSITSIAGCAWFSTNGKLFSPIESCLVNAIADGAIFDPMALVAQCAGATIETLIAVVESLINAATPDSGVAPRLTPYVVRLMKIHTNAKALQAAGVK